MPNLPNDGYMLAKMDDVKIVIIHFYTPHKKTEPHQSSGFGEVCLGEMLSAIALPLGASPSGRDTKGKLLLF